MKINQTIERDCCQREDLRPYLGLVNDDFIKQRKPKFCIHCGQVWYNDKEMGPAGSYDHISSKAHIDI